MTPDLNYTTGRAKVVRASQHIWEGRNKRSEVYYGCCDNTIPKQVVPIDSIWTDCCTLCNWFVYNLSNHRPV